jgi:hypothetical protein
MKNIDHEYLIIYLHVLIYIGKHFTIQNYFFYCEMFKYIL